MKRQYLEAVVLAKAEEVEGALRAPAPHRHMQGIGGNGGAPLANPAEGEGARMGGAIFFDKGGNSTIQTATIFSKNTTTAGAGGATGDPAATTGGTGLALSYEIFLTNDGTLRMTIASATTVDIFNAINGDQRFRCSDFR